MLQQYYLKKGNRPMTSRNKPIFSIIPIGGLGQIGSNMTLISGMTESLIVDCGILFPNEDSYGINYLIPDLDILEQSSPSSLIITHGHEDHIGAIYHIIKKFPNIKVLASPFSSKLIERKFKSQKISVKIHPIRPREEIIFSDFSVTPVQTNHSIPETFGLFFKSKLQSFCSLLISDFKFDDKNPYESPMDLNYIKNISQNFSKRLLLADSTNIKSKNEKTPSEGDLITTFESLFSQNYKRIFVTLFPSNIFRQKTVIQTAKKFNKKVIPYGRSVENYLETAIDLKMIEDESGIIKSVKSINSKDDNLVIIISGCQGDFKGALRRVASGEDPYFKIQEGDLFVFSSTPIPGNEKKISQIMNKIYESGGEAITNSDCLVHASGHPGKEDLKILYDAFNPTDIIPIHGESHLLNAHKDFINESFPDIKAHVIYNFNSLLIDNNLEITTINDPPKPPLFIHGKEVLLEKDCLKQRRKLASSGCLFISIKIESLGKKRANLKLEFFGLPQLIQDKEDEIKWLINNYFAKTKIKLFEKSKEELKIEIRRFCNKLLGYKPIVFIHFI